MSVNIFERLLQVREMADLLSAVGSTDGLNELYSRTPWFTYAETFPAITKEVKIYVNHKRNPQKSGDKADGTDKVGIPAVENRAEGPDQAEKAKPLNRSKRTGRVSKRPAAKADGENPSE